MFFFQPNISIEVPNVCIFLAPLFSSDLKGHLIPPIKIILSKFYILLQSILGNQIFLHHKHLCQTLKFKKFQEFFLFCTPNRDFDMFSKPVVPLLESTFSRRQIQTSCIENSKKVVVLNRSPEPGRICTWKN